MRFRFKLDALLRVRRVAERQQRLLLHRIGMQAASARSELSQLQAAEQQSRAAFSGRLSIGAAGADLRVFQQDLGWYRMRAAETAERAVALDEQFSQQRKAYESARRQRETVEAVRTQQYSVWQQEENRREQRAADDLFIMRCNFDPANLAGRRRQDVPGEGARSQQRHRQKPQVLESSMSHVSTRLRFRLAEHLHSPENDGYRDRHPGSVTDRHGRCGL